MNPNELIEAYVADVGVRLPRKQRNDVAFELRALLQEELQGKSEAAGRDADADMAKELLQAFGHPAEVAARYRPTLTIIDPADGHRFLQATGLGLAIIWCGGLLRLLLQPTDSSLGFLGTLGQWWGNTLIPSFWWPGVLVVGFGLTGWTRRQTPQSLEWQPRPEDRIRGSRAAMAMGILGILCGLVVLIDPRWVLDFFWGGQAADAAYEALTYTETFRQRQAPWLFALLLLNVPLLAIVLVKGHWSTLLRRVNLALSLLTCAVMVWVVLNGPVFLAASSDRTVKFFLVLITAYTLITLGIQALRKVQPAPDRLSRA